MAGQFETPWGILEEPASAATDEVASTAGFPWGAIISVMPWLLQLLFGGPKTTQKQDTTQRTETITPPRQPRSALYSRLEAPIVQMMLGQFKRMQGAGMPGGQGLGMNDMISQLMEMLSGNWQEIMAGDTAPGESRRPARSTQPRTSILPRQLGGENATLFRTR